MPNVKGNFMKEIQNYDEAVKAIKTAILNSQFDAVRAVNEKQLMLYYGIGKYISLNSRYGYWGKGAIDAISERLDRELPGLKGYSARNLRYMRTFYEEWSFLEENFEIADTVEKKEIVKLESAGSKTETAIWNPLVPKQTNFPFYNKSIQSA